MQNNIDIIIFNTLLQKRGLSLPRIGTLQVVLRPARRQGHKLYPPRMDVEFSREQTLTSIIEFLSRAVGTDKLSAGKLYDAWLDEKLGSDGSFRIDSVGVIDNNRFEMDEELDKALNPKVNDVVMERGARNRTLYVLLVIIILLLGVIAFLISRIGPKNQAPAALSEEQISLPAVEQSSVVESLKVVETIPEKDVLECETGVSYAVYAFVYKEEKALQIKDLLLKKGPRDAQVLVYAYQKGNAKGYIVTVASDMDRIECAKKVRSLKGGRLSMENIWIHTQQ